MRVAFRRDEVFGNGLTPVSCHNHWGGWARGGQQGGDLAVASLEWHFGGEEASERHFTGTDGRGMEIAWMIEARNMSERSPHVGYYVERERGSGGVLSGSFAFSFSHTYRCLRFPHQHT